mgnify:CR=1 FL=1
MGFQIRKGVSSETTTILEPVILAHFRSLFYILQLNDLFATKTSYYGYKTHPSILKLQFLKRERECNLCMFSI